MAGLDFRRAAQLFMGTEKELALALGLSPEAVRRYVNDPASAEPAVMARLGRVLVERGEGMVRVGEMLLENGGGVRGNGREA